MALRDVINVLRVVGAALGVVVIVVGLTYAMRMFGVVYGHLQSPEGVDPLLRKWAVAVGGEKLTLRLGEASYHGANVLAVMVLGGGTFILTWIAMGLMLTGAKILAWTTGDLAAVKRVLRHAFGREGKPPQQS